MLIIVAPICSGVLVGHPGNPGGGVLGHPGGGVLRASGDVSTAGFDGQRPMSIGGVSSDAVFSAEDKKHHRRRDGVVPDKRPERGGGYPSR